MMTRHLTLCIALAMAVPLAWADSDKEKTIRICDDTGCHDRPSNYSTFTPSTNTSPEETQRLEALKELARADPRAAYDLGLRFFRGDGVRQDSYQALVWMRDAAERGDLEAQLAVGRFYLMGLEEMGSDPAEAEKWLSIAAGRGDKEAKKLLSEAREARKNEIAYRRWVDLHRSYWYGYWARGYAYRWTWRDNRWYYYR
jgi:TPR repeat protein